MSRSAPKRPYSQTEDDYDDSARLVKRYKAAAALIQPKDFQSKKDLQDLLYFEEGNDRQLRENQLAFKAFLESILYPLDDGLAQKNKRILKDYLETQRPDGPLSEMAPFLKDQEWIWSHAWMKNDEPLFLAATSNVALLIKTFSANLELHEYGRLWCKTLLLYKQLHQIKRRINAPKNKDKLISPCLRVLTEMLAFDGGAFAPEMFNLRKMTLDTRVLGRNITLRPILPRNATEQERKTPTIRTNAVRYFFTWLKYQHRDAQHELLTLKYVTRGLFSELKNDPPDFAIEVLEGIKNQILLSSQVSKYTKSYVFHFEDLKDLVALGRGNLGSEESISEEIRLKEERILNLSRDILSHVVTNPELGVLKIYPAWYPAGSESVEIASNDNEMPVIDVGLDSIEIYTEFERVVPEEENHILLRLLRWLRPYAYIWERELALTIFEKAPGLVAAFFVNQHTFQLDPKLTSTWIGYASFVFGAIQLPTPPLHSRSKGSIKAPPPTSIVAESILPRPLTQRILSRCLHLNPLVRFFAFRLLGSALTKLRNVLKLLRMHEHQPRSLWEETAQRLADEFCTRCPTVKDIFAAWQKIPRENDMEREAALRLIALLHEVLPDVALAEKIDVSPALAEVLSSLTEMQIAPQDSKHHQMLTFELNHLLTIARHSDSVRWFQKSPGLDLSPFTMVLTIAFARSASPAVLQLLQGLARENHLMAEGKANAQLDALVASWNSDESETKTANRVSFLDDCISRLVKKTSKYDDDVHSWRVDHSSDAPISLVHAVLLEQWPHVEKSKDSEYKESIARWISKYLGTSVKIGEDALLLASMRDKLVAQTSEPKLKALFRASFENVPTIALTSVGEQEKGQVLTNGNGTITAGGSHRSQIDQLAEDSLPVESEDHPGLSRWKRKGVEEALIDGDIVDLFECLASQHRAIRMEALIGLQKVAGMFKQSTYQEGGQMWLLCSELLETTQPFVENRPLPHLAASFAKHAALVLQDPSHFLYPKLNHYLQKGPSWDIERLPSYWAKLIILSEPEDDDAHHREVEWFLDFLLDGLRSPTDMEIMRKRSTFERVLALYTSPFTPLPLRLKVLQLVNRAIYNEGSTTLIQRTGILGWIHTQQSLRDQFEVTLQCLYQRLLQHSDKSTVSAWGDGRLHQVVV